MELSAQVRYSKLSMKKCSSSDPEFKALFPGLGSSELCSPLKLLVPLLLLCPGTNLSTTSLQLDPHVRILLINSTSSLSTHSSPPTEPPRCPTPVGGTHMGASTPLIRISASILKQFPRLVAYQETFLKGSFFICHVRGLINAFEQTDWRTCCNVDITN